jgi:CRP-like cAMP-binding protein
MTRADELGGFALLADLTDQQRATVAEIARSVSFTSGQQIFGEGRTADHCWLIRAGRVELRAHRPGAPITSVQTLGPGDVLGWSWAIPPYRWTLDAVAASEVTAVELDADPLRRLCEQDPSLGYLLTRALLATLRDRLHATRARLLDLYGSPRER